MDNQKVKEKNIVKKICFIAVSCFAAISLLLLVMPAVSIVIEKKIPTRLVDESIRFSLTDYEIDIFNDPVYATKNLNFTLSEYGDSYVVSVRSSEEGNWHGIAPQSLYEAISPEAAFFRDYFICIISGNYSEYKSFFSDNFFKYYSIPEKFTMQKIYDIEIEVFSREQSKDSQIIIENYIVRYKIMNNNGSFRGDVASDTVKPLYFKLVKDNNKIKIDSIIFPKEK